MSVTLRAFLPSTCVITTTTEPISDCKKETPGLRRTAVWTGPCRRGVGTRWGGLHHRYDLGAQGEIAKILVATQLDWMKAQFRLMGKGRRAESLALEMISQAQGSAMLAHALNDASVVKKPLKGFANGSNAKLFKILPRMNSRRIAICAG